MTPRQEVSQRTLKEGEGMAYNRLEEVTGVGKTMTIRNKRTGTLYRAVVIDEVSVSDGEQKYVAQLARLEPDICCEGDPTRNVIRLGYYTQRTDGWFCFGSQYAPILTPAELRALLQGIRSKGWLADPDGPI